MADNASGAGPFAKTLRLIAVIGIILMCVQVALNPAAARPQVACYPIYLAYNTVTVDLPQLVIPKAHDFHLMMIEHSMNVHDRCVSIASAIPGFGQE
ncbi:hypothetical protein J7355_16650 [Endozoicomonas sp. G2_2]|uniref:hypothetical protein n=1 Tax=Endozoicomonas sp. G2_2 TaxID=2821092 RepID=UPI001ADCF322|nr:hypothetical protein [Endozoicomonas sp. G2_2]MBO9471722.1 hypothetical protein [Endozoicomonas sp. G2_2]